MNHAAQKYTNRTWIRMGLASGSLDPDPHRDETLDPDPTNRPMSEEKTMRNVAGRIS
jgi:hypothetical protein